MIHPTPEQIAYMQAHAHEDRRAWFIGVNVACLALAFLALSLRIASRVKIGTKIGLDDWLIGLATLLVTGHATTILVNTRYGFARHAVLVTDKKMLAILSLVAQTFYNLCTGTIKLSILCLYARIFNRTVGWFTPTLYVTALFVFLVMIPQCFAYVFQCVPIDSLWNEYGPGQKVFCINFKAVIMAFGVIHILTDWWILALPIPVILGLRLDKRTKYSICSLFLIGGFVCVISIIRIFFAKRVETVDPSWDYVPISTISTLECSSGILAACMPTWRPLFKFLRSGVTKYFATYKSGTRSRSGSNMQYGNNSNVNRGKIFGRNRSKSRKSTIAKIDHNGMGTGMLGGLKDGIGGFVGTKRSETSMSGSSIEKILKPMEADIELEDKAPPRITISSAKDIEAGKGRTQHQPRLDLTGETATYEAKAGADRWEGLMKQQRLKNESEERGRSPNGKDRGRYGDVAFGGGHGATRSPSAGVGTSSEDTRSGGLGIVVTKTHEVVSGSGPGISR